MYAQTGYGYATVALAARDDDERPYDPEVDDLPEPVAEEDRDAPSLDESLPEVTR